MQRSANENDIEKRNEAENLKLTDFDEEKKINTGDSTINSSIKLIHEQKQPIQIAQYSSLLSPSEPTFFTDEFTSSSIQPHHENKPMQPGCGSTPKNKDKDTENYITMKSIQSMYPKLEINVDEQLQQIAQYSSPLPPLEPKFFPGELSSSSKFYSSMSLHFNDSECSIASNYSCSNDEDVAMYGKLNNSKTRHFKRMSEIPFGLKTAKFDSM